MLEERGIEYAAGSQVWLRRTLEEIVSQVRRLLDVTGVSFLVVDPGHAHIRPAASWFASDAVRDAFGPVLDRPYDPERAGVTEAAVETGSPVRIERIEDWPGAQGLHDRLFDSLDDGTAQRLWDWYSSSSFLSCPVATRDGRILGVLAIARSLPQPAFSAEDLRVTEVLADLAAFALERAQLLDDEEALGRATRAVSATLDPAEVIAAVLAQVRELTGAVDTGFLPADQAGRVRGGNAPDLTGAAVRVPVALGARLFGVLTVTAPEAGFAPGGVARLVALAPVAAAALANAHAYDRERRVARAMTAGFVPQRPPALDDHEVGVVYEPAGREASGGDVFGIWTLPDGELGLLVGDVSGSGLEVAATAAMVRFFVEARTFDCDRPAEVLRQTNAILCSRLPEGLFVPAFLAIADGRRLRWCNAGHPPPQLLRAAGAGAAPGTSGGGHAAAALGTTGLPLGIDADAAYEEQECALAPGDVLLAATDGLWEARRAGVQFGDARLPGLLAEHGLALAPQALAERLRDEAHEWAPELADDLVVLAVRVR
jgi:GAF domain-containing protein